MLHQSHYMLKLHNIQTYTTIQIRLAFNQCDRITYHNQMEHKHVNPAILDAGKKVVEE